jgi:5-formyltetrahydrofolate cyclo-ligase
VTVPQQDHEGVREAKKVLRREVRARRAARSPADRTAIDAALAVRLGEIPEIAALVQGHEVGCVAAYASMDAEPGTTALRELLRLAGVGVLLPVIEHVGSLGWAWDVDRNQPRAGRLAIPEPTGEVVGLGATGLLDLGCRVVLVPALAIGYDGRRLGQGGGYYDRLLADLDVDLRRTPRLIAVVHADELLERVPGEEHDHVVDGVLTPASYLRFD